MLPIRSFILAELLWYIVHTKNIHVFRKNYKSKKRNWVIKKLNNVLPRKALLTIYKSLVRLYLDCGDILFHQPYNESITSKLESIQYNSTLAITGNIKRFSRSKLCKELGFEWVSEVTKDRQTFYCILQNSIYPPSNVSFQLNPPINTWLSN